MGAARILFFGEAVTVTHVGRMLYLASRLERAKYTPLLAWDPRFNRILGELPGPFFPAFTIPTDLFLSRIRTGRPVYDFETLERYIHWDLEILRESRPDVIVGDYRLSLAISAYVAGIPYINVINAHWSRYAHPRFVVPDTPFARVFGTTVAQFFFDLVRPAIFRAYAQDFNRLSIKFGRPGYGRDLRQIYCDGDRILYPDLPEITPIEGAPPTHRYLGPVVWSPAIARPPILDLLEAGKSVVYVNLGTSGNSRVLPNILEALGSRPVQVVAATGGRPYSELQAANVYLTDFVPGDDVCAVADLVINNGGSAGVHQALLAGVPVLGIPSNLDQYLNMQYVENAGLGKIVRGDHASTRRIGESVDELLRDGGYKLRAQAAGENARTWQPTKVLEEVLDELIEEAPRTTRHLFPFDPGHDKPTHWPPPSKESTLDWAHAMAEAGHLAPSVGNSQPFCYRWDGQWLGLHLQADRANPFLSFILSDTWLCLGMALENIAFAAALRGEGVDIDVVTQGAREGLVARVRAAAADSYLAQNSPQADSLQARCTNRLPYSGALIPMNIRQGLISADELIAAKMNMEWVDEHGALARAADSLAIYNQIVFEIPGLRLALAKWIQTPKQAKSRNDGLALDTLGIPRVATFMFRMGLSSWLAPVLKPIGFYRVPRFFAARGFRRSGALVFFSLSTDNSTEIAAAGRLLERFWLRATQCGLAVQPLAGLVYLWQRQLHVTEGLEPGHRRMTEQSVATLSALVPAYANSFPLLAFRIGFAPPPRARSQRLPFYQIFENRSPQAKKLA